MTHQDVQVLETGADPPLQHYLRPLATLPYGDLGTQSCLDCVSSPFLQYASIMGMGTLLSFRFPICRLCSNTHTQEITGVTGNGNYFHLSNVGRISAYLYLPTFLISNGI